LLLCHFHVDVESYGKGKQACIIHLLDANHVWNHFCTAHIM